MAHGLASSDSGAKHDVGELSGTMESVSADLEAMAAAATTKRVVKRICTVKSWSGGRMDA